MTATVRKFCFYAGNCSFANAKAAKLEVNVPMIVTHTVIRQAVLNTAEQRALFPKFPLYLIKSNFSGIQTGGNANTSVFVLNEVDTIHASGAIMNTAPMLMRIKMIISVT